MKERFRYFYIGCDKHVVFVPEGKENAVTRRLYKNNNGTYYFNYSKKKVIVEENQLYM